MNAYRHIDIGRWRFRLAAALGSLKLRITLGAVGALVLGIGLISTELVRRTERDTLAAQQHRELGEAVRTAGALSQRVVQLQRALQVTAELLDAQTLADDAKLAAFMRTQPVVRGMFTTVSAIGIDGRARIFGSIGAAPSPDIDVSSRAYFQRTLAEKHANISDPVQGRLTGAPIVVFSHPLQAHGQVYGVLSGALRLASRDLLGDLAVPSDPESEALLVVTDRQGRIVAHQDSQRLLQSLSTEPRLSQAFAEWAAAGSAVEPAGLRLKQPDELVSAGGVAGPDWMVWRAMSQAELLAPLNAARRHTLIWACGLIGIMSATMLALLGWLLRPLKQLENRAQHLFDGSHDPQLGWPDANGEIGQLGRVLRHVSAERAQLESFNTEVLQKLGSVMSAAPIGICFTRQQRFELVSAEFCRLLGHGEDKIVGQLASCMFVSDDEYERVGIMVGKAFSAGQPYLGELQVRRADGTVFWGSLRGAPVDARNAGAGTIWTINDIGDQVAARTLLEWSATHDPLTGLANRTALEARLAAVFEAMPRSMPSAIVMIDLDHFKPINDTAGHAAGDAMLCAVANAITGRVRAGDLVVRLGGDEFALLLERCTPEVALRVAENVRVAVTELALPWQQRTLQVGASLGVAALAMDTADAAAWMAAADTACYRAKAEGRGAVRFASGTLMQVLGQGSTVEG